MLSIETLKHINKLQQKRYRQEFLEFTVEGIKGVEEALKSEYEVLVIIVEGNRRDEEKIADIIKLSQKKDINIEYAGRKEIDGIKTTDTFPGIMAIIEIPEFELDDILNDQPIIALDGINDPGNLGTIIRTADWFGINNILLSENSVDPYNEKCVRSTMGSIFHLNVLKTEDIIYNINFLKKQGYKICSLVMNGKDISTIVPSKKTVYIFGSESHGVSEPLVKISDEKYTISGKGKAESLNVAVASAIVMSKL